ncbi:hypothetical protein CBL_12373 [Carabus blaptoides fortunei]
MEERNPFDHFLRNIACFVTYTRPVGIKRSLVYHVMVIMHSLLRMPGTFHAKRNSQPLEELYTKHQLNAHGHNSRAPVSTFFHPSSSHVAWLSHPETRLFPKQIFVAGFKHPATFSTPLSWKCFANCTMHYTLVFGYFAGQIASPLLKQAIRLFDGPVTPSILLHKKTSILQFAVSIKQSQITIIYTCIGTEV